VGLNLESFEADDSFFLMNPGQFACSQDWMDMTRAMFAGRHLDGR